jgi:hypothetical protein
MSRPYRAVPGAYVDACFPARIFLPRFVAGNLSEESLQISSFGSVSIHFMLATKTVAAWGFVQVEASEWKAFGYHVAALVRWLNDDWQRRAPEGIDRLVERQGLG